MSVNGSRPIVLSVVGAGRSGTTVLASILGEVPGITSAGELRFLWGRGVEEGRPCGCGRPPADCPVWRPVVEATARHAATGATPSSLTDLLTAQDVVKRPGAYPGILRTVGPEGRPPGASLRLVRESVATALVTLAETTGAAVVVDTSKRPLDAAVVAGIDEVDCYVLHLVRDPRAVVHSWRRAKTFTADGRTRTMGTRSLPSSVRRWTSNSLYAEALRRRLPSSRWMHLRYEDFADRPRETIERLVGFVGAPGPVPFVDDRTVLLSPNHIVAGNPSRFTTGEVTIRRDDAWRHEMPVRDQRAIAALTWPLLLRYGYPLGQGAAGR